MASGGEAQGAGERGHGNAFTALRLLLAALVLVSHAWAVAGRSAEPSLAGVSLGTWAVWGFFALSGYLVGASRERLGWRRYLWHRYLRILPAFWVVLLLVALVGAPVTAVGLGERWHADSAATYVAGNAALDIGQYTIDATLHSVPYRPDGVAGPWNGSLWTLAYEVLCYLVLLPWGGPTLRRRRRSVLLAALTVSAVDALVLGAGGLLGANPSRHLIPGTHESFALLLELLAPFLWGVVLRLYRRPGGPTGAELLAAAVGLVAATYLLHGDELVGVAALPLVGLLVGAGERLPLARGLRHDLSYGVYLYAFPVQQVLAAAGERNPWRLAVSAAVPTAGLAAASWCGIERPALRLRSWSPRPRSTSGEQHRRRGTPPAAAPNHLAGSPTVRT